MDFQILRAQGACGRDGLVPLKAADWKGLPDSHRYSLEFRV